MANNNRIVYNLDFKANLTDIQGQLNKLKQSLNSLMVPKIGQKMSQDMQTASVAAAKLQHHLSTALNPDTGKLDLSRLSLSLKNAGDNANTLASNLLKGGQQGKEAFMQTVNAISNAQQPLLKVNNMFSSLWTTMKNTARWQISSMALTSIYSGISKALTYAKDLNKTLNDIRIVTGETAESMDRFTKSASKMAKEVGSTTLEVAKANLIYRQQGDAAELSARKAEITTKAANVAFDVSAKDMSQYLTAIWNSYQVGEESLEVFVDKLAFVGANTATDMAEIATSMEKVAATANAVGVSYDQLLATVSTVSSATRQSAEQVGTAFKTIYARMGDLKLKGSVEDEDGLSVSLGAVSEQLGQVGIHILDANGQLRDMGYIVEELGNKWSTMSNNEQTAIAQAVGGKRQYTQVMALFENWDKYKKTLEGVATAQGTLSDQNEIFKESWEGALKDAKLEWEELVMSLVNDDFIIDVIQGFSKVLDIIGDISENLGGFKSILLMIVTIFTAKLQPQMSAGLLNLAQNFMILIGQGDKLASSLLKQADAAISAQNLTTQEEALARAMVGVANATDSYNRNLSKMDIYTKTAGKSSLEMMKKELEDLQKEYNETIIAQQNFKNQGMSSSTLNVGRGHTKTGAVKEIANLLDTGNYGNAQKIKSMNLTDALISSGAVAYVEKYDKATGKLTTQYKTLQNQVKNNAKEYLNYGKTLKNVEDKTKTTRQESEKLSNSWDKMAKKKWGDLDFTQKLSMTTSSIMNVSMLISSLTSLFDILGDKTKTTGEKIGASFTALIPVIISLTSTLSVASAAGVGFMTALAPLLVVAGVMVTWKLFDHFIVTAEEAKKKIKELEAEYKELEGQLKESREKDTSINNLYKEYQVLKDLQKYGKLTDEQRQKLVSISEDLVNTYDLEVSGLRDLTGAYNISKSAIDAYTDALRKERLEKQKDLLENRIETNQNLARLRENDFYEKGEQWAETFTEDDMYRLYTTSDDKIKSIKEEYLLSAGFNYKEIEDLKEKYLGKATISEFEEEVSRMYAEKAKQHNSEIPELRKQILLNYNSQMAQNINDIIEQQTAGTLNQDEFNLISGFTGTFLSSTTNQYAENIRTNEAYMKQYAEQVGKFSIDYGQNIANIVETNNALAKMMQQGGLDSSGYQQYYDNIEEQRRMLETARNQGLIDEETLNAELDKLANVVEEDIGLRLTYISNKYADQLKNTFFDEFADNIINLRKQFTQGKIDFDNYIDGVTKKIKETDWSKLDFSTGNDKIIDDEFTVEMINTFSQIGEEATDAFIKSFKPGESISADSFDKLDSIIDYYKQMSVTMADAFDNKELVDNSISKLEEYKTQLSSINDILKTLKNNTKIDTKSMAKSLEKVGITIDDLTKVTGKSAGEIKEKWKNTATDTKVSAEDLQTALETGGDAANTAQKLAVEKQRSLMGRIAASTATIIDQLVKKINQTEIRFEPEYDKDGNIIGWIGHAKSGETKTTSEMRDLYAEEFGIEKNSWAYAAAAKDMTREELEANVKNSNWYKNASDTTARDTTTSNILKKYDELVAGGVSGLAVAEFYRGYNQVPLDIDLGSGTPPPKDGDGDEFEPESLIEPKVNDLIDKYRTIQEKILEGLEADGDILDENIDGWDKIINNQQAQNIARDILIDGEKAIQEGLNTILTDLLTTTGRSMEEISKWMNSEGEESEYFRILKNKTGNDDAVSALEDEFKDYQTIFKAISESKENLIDLEKDSYEGIKSLREKIVSKMEKEIADIDYVMEELQEKDIVNYDAVRDFLFQKIGKTQDLINYYLSQGYLEDSEVIQDLRKQLREFQEFWVDTYDKEYSQRKKELDEIYKEVEYQNKKRIEALQDEITQKQKLIDLEKKHNSVMKELRQTQNDINKNLVESKMSAQWLDKETRELLFNQQDYFEISSKVAEVQEFLNDAYIDYSEKISDLGEDELYLADSLTKQYEAQVAAKKEELEILKASLNLEKKRNALNTALSERNVRVFAGGRWRQVSNTESVQKAYQDLLDTENKIAEAKISAAENSAIREEEATVRNLEKLKKTYEEQNKMMKEKIEEMEHNWTILNSNFNLAGQSAEQLTRRFGIAITEIDTVVKQLSASKQGAKNVEIGGGSFNKNYSQTEKDAINNIAWYKGVWESGNADDKKWAATEAQKEYAKLDSNTKTALENMNAEGAKLFNDKINQKNAKGTRNAKGGISQINELGIELLATNDGQFIELNPHEKIFNNDQMNFLYDYSLRGVQSAQRKISSTSNYNQDLMNIENITLQLPNVKDTESFAEGLKNLKSYVRNTMTIKKR